MITLPFPGKLLKYEKPPSWTNDYSFINWRIFSPDPRAEDADSLSKVCYPEASWGQSPPPWSLDDSNFNSSPLFQELRSCSVFSFVLLCFCSFCYIFPCSLDDASHVPFLLFSTPFRKAQLKFKSFTLLWGWPLSYYSSGRAAMLALFNNLLSLHFPLFSGLDILFSNISLLFLSPIMRLSQEVWCWD